jgi:myo-inositol-1(or 4)-monophosphatase
MNTVLYKQFENDAKQWVEEAGKILVSHEHNFTVVNQKDEMDIATNADIEVEQYFRKVIAAKYPDHAVYGEELGLSNPNATYVWVIDPLDCTKEYVKGVGEYNTLVAVEEQGQLVAGVVRRFGHDLVYSASKGNGAYLGETKLHVSTTSSLDLSFIGMNFPNKKRNSDSAIDTYVSLLESLMKQAYRIRPGWDDAKMFAWVAQGAHDAVVSIPIANKWVDVAPAILLVTEAGGKVTDWHGNSIVNHDLSKGILVSNGIVHEQLLTIVKEAI